MVVEQDDARPGTVCNFAVLQCWRTADDERSIASACIHPRIGDVDPSPVHNFDAIEEGSIHAGPRSVTATGVEVDPLAASPQDIEPVALNRRTVREEASARGGVYR